MRRLNRDRDDYGTAIRSLWRGPAATVGLLLHFSLFAFSRLVNAFSKEAKLLLQRGSSLRGTWANVALIDRKNESP